MTIHCAIMYYDLEHQCMGYLLGADSCAGILQTGGIFEIDKSFKGETTVGVVRGVVSVESQDVRTDFLRNVNGLEALFEDIEDGADYSRSPLTQNFPRYSVLLGKKRPSSIELYTISNQRKKHNGIAKKLHIITPEMFDQTNHTFLCYAPCIKNHWKIKIKKRLDFQNSLKIIRHLLKLESEEDRKIILKDPYYQPGTPVIYLINPEGIKKINGDG